MNFLNVKKEDKCIKQLLWIGLINIKINLIHKQKKCIVIFLKKEYIYIYIFIKRKHIELTLLFEKFDNDGSKALDFIEVYRMFRKYNKIFKYIKDMAYSYPNKN